MNPKQLARLLRSLADLVERTDVAALHELLGGKRQFVLESVSPPSVAVPGPQDLNADLESIKGKLGKATSVDEGLRLLAEEGIDKRRSLLTQLARNYDVGIRKSERLGDFARRIVNAVVGSRVQSETMRSLAL